jgi:hypothetical protein
LAQQLLEAGERVVDVPPTLAARVRPLGSTKASKNDTSDALATAGRRVAALRAADSSRTTPRFNPWICRLADPALGEQFFCAPTFHPRGECGDPVFVIKKVDIPTSVAKAFEDVRTSEIQGPDEGEARSASERQRPGPSPPSGCRVRSTTS